MYNRYIPQSDGTYRRNKMQEQPGRHPQSPPPKPRQETCPAPPPVDPPCEPAQSEPQIRSCPKKNSGNPDSITGFFKQLLPKNLDTADLLIIILLLLMAGDCEESRNNALLTLALYFFL